MDVATDPQEPVDGIDELLAIRKPGAHLEAEEVVADDFVLMLGVDLVNFPKFPKSVDGGTTFPLAQMDVRQEIEVDSGAELGDYSGEYRPEFRLTDFSDEALSDRYIPYVEAYMVLCLDGWFAEVSRRYGADITHEIEWTAWNDQIVPEVERMRREHLPAAPPYVDPNAAVPAVGHGSTRVDYSGVFSAGLDAGALTKAELVRWVLGSHEYLLQCIEAWATQLTVRYGLDTMFDIQFTLWGDTVLPGAKKLKEHYFGITGSTVADWMKDLQIDATALPGKAFDLTFEMPEPDVGIMTFNRCVAVDQWEAMGRPDILEKNCHSTCPKSMIVTTKFYDPNMKVDILAIPPRVDEGDVCCKWRFSMRDETDPEYVPVELTEKPARA